MSSSSPILLCAILLFPSICFIRFQRDPRPTTSSGLFNFFQPFDAEVWLTFVVAYLAAAVTLWVAARITPYEKKNPKAPPVYTLTSSLWFVFSSPFRGSNITPQVGWAWAVSRHFTAPSFPDLVCNAAFYSSTFGNGRILEGSNLFCLCHLYHIRR